MAPDQELSCVGLFVKGKTFASSSAGGFYRLEKFAITRHVYPLELEGVRFDAQQLLEMLDILHERPQHPIRFPVDTEADLKQFKALLKIGVLERNRGFIFNACAGPNHSKLRHDLQCAFKALDA